jgi:hypothetical protein
MIRNLNLMALCLGAAVTAFAADPNVSTTPSNQPLNAQIASEARSAHKLASNVVETLKQKNASLDSVHESVSSIEKNVAEINRLVAELESGRSAMNAKQLAELDRLKTLSQTMEVFFNNKKQLAEAGPENRQSVRSQAIAVRQRAELIEKAALKIGG